MRIHRRLAASPALVVACLALLVSLTGTSVAAVSQLAKNSVGTAQLKNNAVTSAKVRNGSLLERDFKAGQLPLGPRGPRGPQGPRGVDGPEGPRGPSELRQAISFVVGITFSGTFQVHRSLSLPAGSWLVSSTFSLDNSQPTVNYVLCQLLVGGTVVDTQDIMLGPNEQGGERIAVSLEGGHTLGAAGAAEVQCRSLNGPGVVLNPSITALQVATIVTA